MELLLSQYNDKTNPTRKWALREFCHLHAVPYILQSGCTLYDADIFLVALLNLS